MLERAQQIAGARGGAAHAADQRHVTVARDEILHVFATDWSGVEL